MKYLLDILFQTLTLKLLIVATFHPAFTQKFGKVDLDLIVQELHPLDSTADACYVIKKAKAYFDITPVNIFLVVEHHQRIKIYNEDGERFGKYALPLYNSGSNREKISGLKAFTFNEENGKIIESKLNKKDVFNEKTSDKWTQQKFALPDVRAGSVLDVKYELRTPFRFSIPRFTFQEDVPVDMAEYEVRIPSYYTYTPVPTGYVPIERSQKEVRGDYNTDLAYTFKATKVPALAEDNYVLDIDDYRSGLKYELYSSQFPNSVKEYFVKDWNEIAKDLMDDQSFGKELKKRTKSLEPFLESINSLSDTDKIQSIYSYVQENYSWDGDYGIGKNEGVKNLLKNKTGNVGDINLLLINLLIHSGINAKPFVLKPRQNGLLNASFPSLTELRYLLAYVPQGDSFVLLDATSKYTPIGQLPTRAVNINGLLIEGETGKILEINNPNIYKTITMATYDIDLDIQALVGSGQRLLKNYAATSYRRNEDNKSTTEDYEEDDEESEDDEEEEFAAENSYTIIEISNLEDIKKDIKLSYVEQIYNEIAMIGDQIFIDAAVDFGIKDNPFFEETREYPVFFSSMMDTRQVITINIPDGYIIESLPSRISMSLPNKTAIFQYEAKPLGDKLVINYSFKINTDYFLPEEYPNLKELYNRIVDKSKEKIVLSPNSD